MTTMKIIGIEKDTERGFISVLKELTEDDGTVHINQHFFPEDAVEWKMAEFDTDQQTALDIILHEPFSDPSTYKQLYEFDSKEEALTHVKQNIDDIKRKMTPKNAKAQDVECKQILDLCTIHDEALGLKRRHIDIVFEMKNSEKKEGSVRSGATSRIDRLKSMLQAHERKLEV